MAKTPAIFETAFESYTVDSSAAEPLLGEGGAGRVHAVVDSSGREFALKVLRAEAVSTEKSKRFKNEIAFCSSFSHPNIIQVRDIGFHSEGPSKCPFYVMDRYPTTLRKALGSSLG